MDKLQSWSLSFTSYFNLAHVLSIVSIWFITFQFHVNLVPTVIYWMKISNMANSQNKKLFICHVNKHLYHHISFFKLKKQIIFETRQSKFLNSNKIPNSCSSPFPLSLVSLHQPKKGTTEGQSTLEANCKVVGRLLLLKQNHRWI